ncbi:MAG: hypothetical protein NZ891_00480 [bacterium]|nr:hypothetical protein [bacterium]MDW8163208.1 hypothetical protein [Candidatus Omnitrophota bacterium]
MILNKLEEILKMNRQYLSFLLRNTGRRIVNISKGDIYRKVFKRGIIPTERKKEYIGKIEEVLFKIWIINRKI